MPRPPRKPTAAPRPRSGAARGAKSGRTHAEASRTTRPESRPAAAGKNRRPPRDADRDRAARPRADREARSETRATDEKRGARAYAAQPKSRPAAGAKADRAPRRSPRDDGDRRGNDNPRPTGRGRDTRDNSPSDRKGTRQTPTPTPERRPRRPAGGPTETMRIAKAMARAGLCSRRDAERWIEEGRVKVNGETLASPARDVGPKDKIVVDGAPLPAAEPTRLWRYAKPRGLVTTHRDPEGRPTVFDNLPDDMPRVVSIGRLDVNTEGLLLLTTDGELARYLELPATGWLRRYRVRAHVGSPGGITQAQLDELKDGITVEGIHYGPVEATLDSTQGTNVWLTIGLREGKNREVRKILATLDLDVNRLIRVSFGPFQLLDLEPGKAELIRRKTLIEQLGPRLAKQFNLAGDDEEDAAPPAQRPARGRPPRAGARDKPSPATRGKRDPDARARPSRPADRDKPDPAARGKRPPRDRGKPDPAARAKRDPDAPAREPGARDSPQRRPGATRPAPSARPRGGPGRQRRPERP